MRFHGTSYFAEFLMSVLCGRHVAGCNSACPNNSLSHLFDLLFRKKLQLRSCFVVPVSPALEVTNCHQSAQLDNVHRTTGTSHFYGVQNLEHSISPAHQVQRGVLVRGVSPESAKAQAKKPTDVSKALLQGCCMLARICVHEPKFVRDCNVQFDHEAVTILRSSFDAAKPKVREPAESSDMQYDAAAWEANRRLLLLE